MAAAPSRPCSRSSGGPRRRGRSTPDPLLRLTAAGMVSRAALDASDVESLKAVKLPAGETVEAVLKAAGAEVVGFQRLAVGEGIEKVVEDYAAEVMKQAGLA